MTCGQLLKFSLSKLVVEMFGTFMLTLFFYGNKQAEILTGLWILIVFAWKISGGHFNPAITFAFMFRRDAKKLPISLGVAYMGAQVLGAFLAALLLVFFTNNQVAALNTIRHCFFIDAAGTKTNIPWTCNVGTYGVNYYDHTYYIRAMTQEGLGTFIYVLFFMMQTDEKMFFSREKAINCFIIASSYVAARAMFYGESGVINQISSFGAVLNPAISLGIMLGALMNGVSSGTSVLMLWLIYPLMPIAGSLLSLIFFEFVYKKTQEVLEHDGDDKADTDGILDN